MDGKALLVTSLFHLAMTSDCLLLLCRFHFHLHDQGVGLNHGLCLPMGFQDPVQAFGVYM